VAGDEVLLLGLEPEWDIPLTRGWGWPYMPQTARLEDAVLIVERRYRVRSCDLVTAAQVAVESRWYGRGAVVHVLTARQEPAGHRVDLVIVWMGSAVISPSGLRRLAQILGRRPDAADSAVQGAVGQLLALADREDQRRTPIDWNFRTSPQGIRARQEKDDQSPDARSDSGGRH
jgi:hypothetical protein